ncbi:unnamed protein product [Amoebophrya sp. A120]|nr:unnamed protein product [Amoebophrya sp. A120]|eukprot:GSA120T00004285001.1
MSELERRHVGVGSRRLGATSQQAARPAAGARLPTEEHRRKKNFIVLSCFISFCSRQRRRLGLFAPPPGNSGAHQPAGLRVLARRSSSCAACRWLHAAEDQLETGLGSVGEQRFAPA